MHFISRRQLFAAFLTATMLVATAVSVSARAIDRVVVFGDSLSDNGNLSDLAATGGVSYPNAPYDPDSLSNGDVWAEYFATALGVPLDDRAFAGSFTDTRNTVNAYLQSQGFPPVAPGMKNQVDGYIGSNGGANPNNLYALWGGANDQIQIGLGNSASAANAAANNIRDQIAQLANAGATQFLVFNLPNLGSTPLAAGNPAAQFGLNQLTTAHNSQLAFNLAQLSLSRPNISIKTVDINSLFVDVLANPGNYGFTNTTNPYVTNAGELGVNATITGVGPASGYVFWDLLHPTTTVHEIISQRAVAVVVVPEGSTAGLLGAGCSLLGAGVVLRRRRKA